MAPTSTFTVSAQPNTDIWKKAPSHDVFNAPHRPHSRNPLPQFSSASITFTASYTQQYDQAGILLTFTKPSAPRKWIKAGIELYNDQPRLSTVCCDNWADWSVANTDAAAAQDIRHGRKTVTILVEKETSDSGACLWVYQVDGEQKVPMREICWVFGDNGGEEWELEVSALVARPAKDTQDVLEAQFQGFDVKWTTA